LTWPILRYYCILHRIKVNKYCISNENCGIYHSISHLISEMTIWFIDLRSKKVRRAGRFIYEFLKHPTEIGTVTQSSRPLARAMAQEIDGSLHIIELGAGMGTVTTQILRRLPRNGRLTSFEINPRFCEYLLRIGDPRLKVINDDAMNCEKYVDCLECVVSGLPLVLFSKSEREKILRILSKSKRLIQLQYSLLLRKTIKNYFSEVKTKFVPLNFPPAFIHVCSTFTR